MFNRAANAFRLAAQAVSRSKTALGAFYRRIKARSGAPKAITATAHKIACREGHRTARLFYTLWTTKESYLDKGADYYEQQYKQRTLDRISKKAESLGYQLVAVPQA